MRESISHKKLALHCPPISNELMTHAHKHIFEIRAVRFFRLASLAYKNTVQLYGVPLSSGVISPSTKAILIISKRMRRRWIPELTSVLGGLELIASSNVLFPVNNLNMGQFHMRFVEMMMEALNVSCSSLPKIATATHARR